MNRINRSIDINKVGLISGLMLNKVDEMLDSKEFPDSFTSAEFAIASHLVIRTIEKRVNPASAMIPIDIYLDEFSKSYSEFFEKVSKEGI